MADVPAPARSQRLWVQKAGSRPEECEDAGLVWPPSGGAPHTDGHGRPVVSLYTAVSDGASESLLAGAWARQLVVDAVNSMAVNGDWWRDRGGFVGDVMGRSAAGWETFLARYQEDRAEQGRPITWYEQPGLEKGAFATLLGAEIRGTALGDGTAHWSWHAFALGDSCLFHLRDGLVHDSFPMRAVEEFGITPQLLGSRNHDVALVTDRMALAEGELRPGDELLLTTDALAAWVLSRGAGAPAPGQQLAALCDLGQEDFADWVEEQRARGEMRNDDVMLIRTWVRAEA